MAEITHTDYDPATYWTTSAKNFRSSARLHLQHLLFQRTLGYVLEGHVQDYVSRASSPVRVADIGCGNGAWLCDLNDELVKAGTPGQLDGYDVNVANFPAPDFLPSTINLKELDTMKPPPEEIVGIYDIVHIRAFSSILVDTGVTPLLSFVHAILKPGGYVQWEEVRGDKFVVEAAASASANNVSTEACDTISQMLQAASKARGSDFGFIDRLDEEILGFGGFEDVHKQVLEKRRQDYKAWTEDILMIWGELAVHFPTKADAPTAKLTRESYLDLFRRAIEETENGVAIHQRLLVVAVGRKTA
ncbi:hypothetical protein PG985_014909 [Apiospora marii]|uniref:Methyltransferase domain-containing protein n=1 Tax=Apiospora marii TaxID=335849 RepID=A0ABR1RIV4_9PEZI